MPAPPGLAASLPRNVGGLRYGAGSGSACLPASELTGAHAAGSEEDKGPSDSRAPTVTTLPLSNCGRPGGSAWDLAGKTRS
jgi:hypothetical protein